MFNSIIGQIYTNPYENNYNFTQQHYTFNAEKVVNLNTPTFNQSFTLGNFDTFNFQGLTNTMSFDNNIKWQPNYLTNISSQFTLPKYNLNFNSFNFGFNNFNWGFNNNFNLYSNITSTRQGGSNKAVDNTKKVVTSSSWNSFKQRHSVKSMSMNGSTVYGCRWTSFKNSQPEWINLQKYMIQAAEEMDLTLVYSDMDRSVAASNAARAKKGSIVVEGGKSPHNYGTAADICLFSDGKLVSSKSKLFEKYARRVMELSDNQIEWGGDWKKPDEEHHFQLRNWKKYKQSEHLIT